MCFGCGGKNTHGLRLSFSLDPAHKKITTTWIPLKEHQGYADIVHGGMTAVVLDELIGNLLWKQGTPAVTAELTVRFRKPAHVGRPLSCEAHLVESAGRVYRLKATAKNLQGELIAEAEARCVQMGHK